MRAKMESTQIGIEQILCFITIYKVKMHISIHYHRLDSPTKKKKKFDPYSLR